MKHYLVTLKNYARVGSTLNDCDRHIVPVDAVAVHYTNGDLLFYDDVTLVRGVARGEWVTFREVDADVADQYGLAS